MGVTVETPKATATTETKKTNVAATIIHVGEKPDVKVFQKGEEVKGITKDELQYLKDNGFVKEV